jgi:hypothetical protein
VRHLWRIAAVVACLIAGPLRADEAGDIKAVIGDQIHAFEANDITTAYSFASPMIRSLYPSAEVFGAMVQQGYPMIWRPSDVIYYGLRSEGGRMVQRMGFRDAAGQEHLFDYIMSAGPAGWKIDGVIPVRGGGEAV